MGQAVEQGQSRHRGSPVGLHLGVGRDVGGRQGHDRRRRQGIVASPVLGQEELDGRAAGLDLLLVGDHVDDGAVAGQVRRQCRGQGRCRAVEL